MLDPIKMRPSLQRIVCLVLVGRTLYLTFPNGGLSSSCLTSKQSVALPPLLFRALLQLLSLLNEAVEEIE